MEIQFNRSRPIDVIAVGRATIDLYANEIGPLEKASTFTKYVGGSPANTAVAMSKMGLNVGYIGKVSSDPLGKYIKIYLSQKGVDVSHIYFAEKNIRTGITIGELKSPSECNCFMYRNNAADLHISCSEIDESYVKQASAILISGTSLTSGPAREAVFTLIEYAKKNNVRIIFDPDYRKYTWNSPVETAVYYLLAAEKADIVLGTREEFNYLEALIMPGNTDDNKTAKNLLSRGVSLISIKHGKKGSTVYTCDGHVYKGNIYPAKVLKTFGAGDAYAGSFIYGLLNKKSIQDTLNYAAAASAITISGHSCSDSIPTLEEVEKYIASHKMILPQQ
ncbi:5-dehydro-2-deoxygluconokinase [Pectinatus frisingensis]|uniref:5-dehydro-2-deoxygluconokinase n=1 Tax=Pectinatus frisingensis TaxID=865 RepID=UPI001E5E7BBD|nr:5-dehydro-2-deoxygluconokinase [Pectinatus frisingensis]